jgi:hypothetical protein
VSGTWKSIPETISDEAKCFYQTSKPRATSIADGCSIVTSTVCTVVDSKSAHANSLWVGSDAQDPTGTSRKDGGSALKLRL